MVVLAGCTRLSAADWSASGEPAQRSAPPVQHTLDRLADAIRDGDRPAFDAVVSTGDPAFAAGRFWDSLQALPLTEFALLAVGSPRAPAPDRRAGPLDRWRQRVRITWRLPGEARPAQHEVGWTFVDEAGTVRLAGIATPSGGSAGDPAGPIPLWTLEPIETASEAAATVVSGPGIDPRRWVAPAQAAFAAVRSRLPPDLRPQFRQLVVEVPSTRARFEQTLGVAAGTYRRIAAVSWPEGPVPRTAAVRVVVNPELAGTLGPPELLVVLAHEAVHVATRSAVSPAPLWLVEGYADVVAYAAAPDAARPSEQHLRTAVGRNDTALRLPGDADFRPERPALDQTYATAFAVCRFIASRYSAAALARLYRAADTGTPIGEAIPQVLGVTERQLLAQWRSELSRSTGG